MQRRIYIVKPCCCIAKNECFKCCRICSHCQDALKDGWCAAGKMIRKFEIAYTIAKKGITFNKMTGICNLVKQQGVDLGAGYKTNVACSTFVTRFAKTNLMGTNTEIHFLSIDESHTHALSKDTKQLRLDGQVSF